MEVRKALGIEETGACTEAAAVSSTADEPSKKAGRPKKEKVAKTSAPLPVALTSDDAPDADAYRLPEDEVDADRCQARQLGDQDKRWKPAVYREVQCSGKPVAGTELCATCTKRQEKYAEDESPKSRWHGLITEDPFGWAHMLGTTWAEDKKPKWIGETTEESDAASESDAAAGAGSDAAQAKAEKAAAATQAKAEKAAAAAQAKAEKAAAAAQAKAEKAEKAAAAAQAKAEKAAAAVAAKEAKEAKAKAAAAKKPAATAATAATAKKAAVKATSAAAAAEAAKEADGELKLIGCTMYKVKNGNVYEFNEMDEAVGAYVGRLGPDGESIDKDVPEDADADSESDDDAVLD